MPDLKRQYPSGDGRADIGADDDADGFGEHHQFTIDETDHHDRGDGARLNEGRDENPDAHRQESVGRDQSDQASDSGAGDDLKALLHELHAEQENAQAADYVKTHIQYQINVHNGTVKLVSL